MNINKSNIKGTINIVSSKSLSHRYLIAASLASGTSKITNVLDSKDLEATTNILRNLGVDISINNNTYTVVSNKLINLNKDLFANESGSTLRFFIPITLGIKGNHRFTGASSLGSRSLKVYEDLSSYFNYKISKTNNNFPIIVEGKLEPGNYYIDGSLSSQFITGLLFSLPLLNNDSNINIH